MKQEILIPEHFTNLLSLNAMYCSKCGSIYPIILCEQEMRVQVFQSTMARHYIL